MPLCSDEALEELEGCQSALEVTQWLQAVVLGNVDKEKKGGVNLPGREKEEGDERVVIYSSIRENRRVLKQVLWVVLTRWSALLSTKERTKLVHAIFAPDNKATPCCAKLLVLYELLRELLRPQSNWAKEKEEELDSSSSSSPSFEVGRNSDVDRVQKSSEGLEKNTFMINEVLCMLAAFRVATPHSRENTGGPNDTNTLEGCCPFMACVYEVSCTRSETLSEDLIRCFSGLPGAVLESTSTQTIIGGSSLLPCGMERQDIRALFAPPAFFRALFKQVLLGSSDNTHRVLLSSGWSNFTRSFLSKMCKTRYVRYLAELWSEAPGKFDKSVFFSTFEQLDMVDQNTFVFSFLKSLRTSVRQLSEKRGFNLYQEFFELVFPSAVIREGSFGFNLVTQRLLTNFVLPPSGLFALMDVLGKVWTLEERLDAAVHVCNVWSEEVFFEKSDLQLKVYVTGAVVELIAPLSLNALQSSGLVIRLVQAVSRFLDSGTEETRTLGMLVAQSISRVMDGNSTSSTQFPGLDESSFPYSRSVWQAISEQQEEQEEQETVVENLSVISGKLLEEIPNADTSVQDLQLDTNQVVQFGRRSLASTTQAKENSKKRYSVWSDSSDDDDDDKGEEGDPDDAGSSLSDESFAESLRPLENHEDDFVGRRFKAPVFLASCVEILEKSDEFAEIQAVLESLAARIESEPADMKVSALHTTKTLLHLDNKFALETFAEHKHAALQALAASSQWGVVVPYLCDQALADCAFTSTRFDALDAIAQAALTLSSLENQGSTDFDSWMKQATQLDDSLRQVGTIKRIWGRRRRPLPRTQENTFASIAPKFFFPLLSEPHRRTQLLTKEPIVLAKLVMTLGIVLGCSQNSVHAERMGRALTDLLSWAWANKEPQVRRSVIFASAQVVRTVPRFIVAQDEWWTSWLVQLRSKLEVAMRNDPDPLARDQARFLLQGIA